MRGISSAGRAPALHAGGQEFESPILHQYKVLKQLSFRLFYFYSCPFDVVIRHLKLKCLTHKMINFKFEPF